MMHPLKIFGALAVCLLGATADAAQLPGVIDIPGARVVPESLSSDARGYIYIGSMATGTIYRAEPGSAVAKSWIEPDTNGLNGILGVLADDASSTLWVCSLGGQVAPGATTPAAPSALHAFHLATGKPRARYALPTASAVCNDIAFDAHGNIYATDTGNMQVVRLPRGAQALEVWSSADAYGTKGGVLDGIAVLRDAVYVNTLVTSKLYRTMIAPDGKAGATSEVQLRRALDRPDGMRSFGADALLIVEGGGPGRLSRIDFKDGHVSITTLKEGYADNAVAVTVVGEIAYVLEAQFRAQRDPEYKPKPFRATAVYVGKP